MSEPNACHDFCADDIPSSLVSLPQAVSTIITAARYARTFCFFTLNLDHAKLKLRSDRKFQRGCERAPFVTRSVVTADGFPIVLFGRMSGAQVQETAGADLILPLCAKASRHRLPVFLLGPNAQVLCRSEARLREQASNLEIAGSYALGSNFDPGSLDANAAIERIRQSGARICLFATGSPSQELFATRCLGELPGVVLVCVGDALESIAMAEAPYSPRFFQQNGLAWLWQLSTNPRRLGMRHLRSAAGALCRATGVNPNIRAASTGQLS